MWFLRGVQLPQIDRGCRYQKISGTPFLHQYINFFDHVLCAKVILEISMLRNFIESFVVGGVSK